MLVESSRETDPKSVVLLSIVVFLYWAALYIYVPFLPVHAEDAGASFTLIGLIGGSYGFTQMLARIPLGVWSDRRGERKPFLTAGLILGIVGGVGFVLARDPLLILFSRGVHGLTAAA